MRTLEEMIDSEPELTGSHYNDDDIDCYVAINKVLEELDQLSTDICDLHPYIKTVHINRLLEALNEFQYELESAL